MSKSPVVFYITNISSSLKFTNPLPLINPNQGGLFGQSIEWGGWRNPPERCYELVCPYFSSKSPKHDLK